MKQTKRHYKDSQNIRRRDWVRLPASVALSCPFCGEQPFIKGWHGGGRDKRVIDCLSEYCYANPSVNAGSRPVAIKRWNQRQK